MRRKFFFVAANFFWSPRKCFRPREKLGNKSLGRRDRFLQKSSKSELSSRFLGRLKFSEFTRHFLVTSVDRPKIRWVLVSNSHESWDDWPNSSKSGVYIFRDRSTGDVLLGTQGMSCLEHDECPAWNTRNCLLYTSPSPRDRQKSRMPSSA